MSENKTNNNQTNATDKASQVISELSSLKAQLATVSQQNTDLQGLVTKQQTLLTSPEYLSANNAQAQPAQQADPNATPVQKFMGQLDDRLNKMMESMQGYVDNSLKQVTSLVKNANPDSELWDVTQRAEKLVSEGKVVDMETALNFAKLQLAQEKVQAETNAQAEADSEAALAAKFASDGQPGSASSDSPGAHAEETLEQVMERSWEQSGCEEALRNEMENIDSWDLPPDKQGVQELTAS